MGRMATLSAVALALATAPAATLAHGSCLHEATHTYGVALVHDVRRGPEGAVAVADSETGDCDGDGIAGDFDGDLDTGVGGAAFGHGPWAEHCGFHVETGGSVTVTDLLLADTISFVLASDDALGFLADPTTGENPCITDGFISPGTDLEGDDCIGPSGKGTRPITCPGGGDGLLWVILEVSLTVSPRTITGSNPPTAGVVTSP